LSASAFLGRRNPADGFRHVAVEEFHGFFEDPGKPQQSLGLLSSQPSGHLSASLSAFWDFEEGSELGHQKSAF
jgi:hypothetical protein